MPDHKNQRDVADSGAYVDQLEPAMASLFASAG